MTSIANKGNNTKLINSLFTFTNLKKPNMLKTIKLADVYPYDMICHNPALVEERCIGRRISFPRHAINKCLNQNNFRIQDLEDVVFGNVVKLSGTEQVDVVLNDDIHVRVMIEKVTLEEILLQELEILHEFKLREKRSIDQELQGLDELLNYCQERKLSKLSRKLMMREKITNFVELSMSMGNKKEDIIAGVEKLIEYNQD